MDRRQFLFGTGGAAALAVVAAACGSSGSGSSGGSAGAPSASGGIDNAHPKSGGTVTWATASEIDGFDPSINHWDRTGYAYARTVYDPLAIIDQNGNVQPYLAQSISHNADYTQWTITLRNGITFHDGAPLDAHGVATFFEKMVQSPLAGPALVPITNVTTSGPMSVVVTMKSPWPAFGVYLAVQQTAYPPSPNVWNNPNRGRQPVGTGPFVFKEWVPNDHFTAVKNTKYWRPGMPYLDSITFKPIPDSQAMENALRSGSVDAIFASSTPQVVAFRKDRSVWYVDNAKQTIGEPDITMLMINTAKPPLDDQRLRQALAHATDQQRVITTALNGVGTPVDGPFVTGSPYYSSTGYPAYDPAKAKQLASAVYAQKGKYTIKLGTVNNPADLQICQLVQALWQQAGIPSEIVQVEQAAFITNALLGNFDVYTWNQWSAYDPDQNYIWWSIPTTAPIGKLSLNFARNKDPQIQTALDTGRTSSDAHTRAQAYQTVASRFAVDLPYVYLSRTVVAMVGNPKVRNYLYQSTPEGAAAYHWDGEVWPGTLWVS